MILISVQTAVHIVESKFILTRSWSTDPLILANLLTLYYPIIQIKAVTSVKLIGNECTVFTRACIYNVTECTVSTIGLVEHINNSI